MRSFTSFLSSTQAQEKSHQIRTDKEHVDKERLRRFMLRMEDVLPWRAHKWEKCNIHTKPPETSAAAWGLPLGGTEQKRTPLRRCHHSAEKWLLRHFEFLFAKLKTISIPREVYQMATFPELTLLISTTLLLLPALHLVKKSRSSSRCFCVILEVLCGFFFYFLSVLDTIFSNL